MIAARHLALALVGLLAASTAAGEPLVVGSKAFTESVILGEIVRLAGGDHGLEIRHRRSLGGTRILWRALVEGEIDLYPEYTGTLTQELLPGVPPDADLDRLRDELAPLGLGLGPALGFDDSYALGMLAGTAAEAEVSRISDLVGRLDLVLGFSNEFVDREDGWPGLREAYGFGSRPVRGMDHDLAYRALASGAVDVVDLYTTDAEIVAYGLRVLEDDRGYFPPYEAVLVYRLDAARRHPELEETIRDLGGRIDRVAMQAMNAAVKVERRSESAVASDFLGGGGTVAEEPPRAARVLLRTREHLSLVGISLALALAVALPLGIFAARRPALGGVVLAVTGILQTVPSLALFVFMIPLFGIGGAPAVAALFLYSLLPIVRNTYAGLAGIPPELRESAAALGLPPFVRLWRIELPLAARAILAGISTAAVINVGTATLGALIGAGGYGQPILTGIRLDDLGLILEGAVPAALLALAVQGLFEMVERLTTPRGLRTRARE